MKVGTKHIILFVLAISLIAVGYMRNEIIGFFKGDPDTSEVNKDKNDDGSEDALSTNTLYFSSNRLERDTSRGKVKETYENITKDTNAGEDVKTEAYEKIMKLAETAECETKIEGLIREKGFSDAYVCFNDQGEVDIMIKAENLTQEQVTQVADIVIRYSEADFSDIHIRNVA